MAAPIIQKKNEEKSNTPSSLLTTPPKPGRILHEQFDPRLGVYTLTLSNGIEIKLKPTKFTNNTLSMRMNRWVGLTQLTQENIHSIHSLILSPYFISDMGYGTHTPSALNKLTSGRQFNLNHSISKYDNSISLNTNSNDLEFALQYLYLKLTSPKEDEDLFNKTKKQWAESLKQDAKKPESIFDKEIFKIRFQNHPLAYTLPSETDINALNMQLMLSLYRQYFSDFNQTKISIVGRFDPTKIKPLLERYLGSLPSAYPKPSLTRKDLKDLGINHIQGIVRHEVNAGSEDKAQVRIYFRGVENGRREDETVFYALIDTLNIHITEQLREQKKLIYTGGANGDITRVPSSRFDVSLTLPCAPENVDAVTQAIFEEINKLKEQGPSLSDLKKIQKNWLLAIETNKKTNGYWLNKLQETQMYQYDPYLVFGSEKRIKNLTVASIQEAAKRYFSETNYVHAVLLPEKKQTEEQKR
jgi:zinc protease